MRVANIDYIGMNYFTHGVRFLDRPLFLAGTAVPDWLSVADRTVRLREKRLQWDHLPDDDPLREFSAGVRQHLHDDEWFHRSRAFYEVTSEVADLFRAHLGPEDGFRPGFLGHIATEMLLDRLLIERFPESLAHYYAALDRIDPHEIQALVNRIGPKETHRLAVFVDAFRQVRFLFDYRNSDDLLKRLNQVMRRVKLAPLPLSTAEVLEDSFDVLRRRGWELLPEDQFAFPHD